MYLVPVSGAVMLRIQPARCTGLIHDLVDGAARVGEHCSLPITIWI